jgi:hypothetical protein
MGILVGLVVRRHFLRDPPMAAHHTEHRNCIDTGNTLLHVLFR